MHFRLLIIFVLFSFSLLANETRLKAMGNLSYSVPDIDAQLNLFRIAENNAWMKVNDSTNWMIYSINSLNNWGTLKRYWDAKENQFHYFSFSGLKHLGEKQVFYGYVSYIWDLRRDVNNAIEKNPYDYDPFVLADYTTGDFLYHGPEMYAAYNYTINSMFHWGISLRCYINRGLKEVNTEPEIISREINASFDFIFKLTAKYSLGLSFKPYQILDITKFVELEDGLTPITRRYRGEYFYREKVTTHDRSAQYEGYILRPQLGLNFDIFENVTHFDYFYQWHKLFDKPSKHLFDGYFQAQHYTFRTVNRLLLSKKYNSYILVEYTFKKNDDWAKEPRDNLLIYQALQKSHELVLGGSSKLYNLPLLAAFELIYGIKSPIQKDYLANVYRDGDIATILVKSGLEYQIKPDLDLRVGYIFSEYSENKIWNYYGNFSGSKFTFGSGWIFNNFELDILGEYEILKKNKNNNSRTGLNFIAQLKQYL
jgi:hypothetical protein